MPRASLALALPLALFASLLAGAACSGRTTSGSTSSPDGAAALDAGPPGAGAVDLLDGSAPPVLDSASSAPALDATSPPWPYNLEAAVPDPFDASCGALELTLDPDASPNTCEVSPADVACDAASDCTVLPIGHCCYSSVYGVNRASTASCPLPPCAPPSGPCGTTGYVTEDCSDVPSLLDVGVACVSHRCRTFAAVAP